MLRKDFYREISTPISAYDFAKFKGVVYSTIPNCPLCGRVIFFEKSKTRLNIKQTFSL